jgi:hypothetical protein
MKLLHSDLKSAPHSYTVILFNFGADCPIWGQEDKLGHITKKNIKEIQILTFISNSKIINLISKSIHHMTFNKTSKQQDPYII